MVGSGQINGFAILQKDVFTQDYYTQIYLTAADAYDEIAFTEDYQAGTHFPFQEDGLLSLESGSFFLAWIKAQLRNLSHFDL